MAKQHHVVPNGDNGWCVKTDNAKKASRCFLHKKDAVNYARELSRKQKTELVIHNKDGKIAQKDSHGNDPYPPKG
ncbi:DUF2188 domain-containing protein [Nitratiruptor sp. YY09-18]|uniref:DUF2188 domain-containing protein n=1 Tax=Nitratiruptor sp. YY09-18 TaxID=2724901 RepID=UPI001915BC59|nr:DUF2188 domain-containing protein [Nitratiruptor sp. YY09-18]